MNELQEIFAKLERMETKKKLQLGAIVFVGLVVSIALFMVFHSMKKVQTNFDYSQFDKISQENAAIDRKITELQGEIPKINARIDARNHRDQAVEQSIQDIDRKLSKITTNEKNTSVYKLGPDSLRREYSNIRNYLPTN